MKLAVIIPTYNAAKCLIPAVESVFNQTQPPAELIIVDDRSTDGTVELIQTIISQAPIPTRFILLNRNTGGPARPLNIGIASSDATHIAVLEQDDVMPPNRLQWSLEAFTRFPECDVSFGRFEVTGVPLTDLDRHHYDPERQLENVAIESQSPDLMYFKISRDIAFRILLHKNIAISNSNLVFTRALWQKVGGFDTTVRVAADRNFLLASTIHSPIVFVNNVCLCYAYSAQSLCRQPSGIDWTIEQKYRNWIALRHPELLGQEWWQRYWSTRTRTVTALRQRRFREAFHGLRKLISSRALFHHWRHRGASQSHMQWKSVNDS